MQRKGEQEDELIDYNDEPEDVAGESGSRQLNSNTPVQTPEQLDSELDEDEIDEDLETGQDPEPENKSPELAQIEQREREFNALSSKLIENGWKMRMKVWADTDQAFRPTPMTAPTKTLAETLRTVPVEDAEQISEFQGLVYMPEHFLEKYLLPTMQIRKLLETENQTTTGNEPLPGGPETAIMYSLYHHTRAAKSTTLDNKLRSLVTHSITDTSQLVREITESTKAKEKSLEMYTNQLREVTTLPTLQTICRMTAQDVTEKNRLISSVLSNFEQQLKRDYKAFERERHQNVLIAKLNYEQQLHIIENNRQYLALSNQRQEIVNRTAGLDVQIKVSAIKDNLKSLQEEMAQQCRDLSSVLGPLDATHLMETMRRLRDALQDVTYQNAYLVMNNNELTLENSFMTPVQKSTIKKIKAEQSRHYTQQRVNPHYIEAYPQGTIMFQPYDLQQEPCVSIDTEELIKEVDEVLFRKGIKRENQVLTPTTESSTSDSTVPPPAGRGKGKRVSDARSQDRSDPSKYPRTDNTLEQGSKSFKSALTGKGKQWYDLTSNNVYIEPTDGSPGWYNHGNPKGKGKGKGKIKGKNYAEGHRYNGNITGIGSQTPSNVPSLNSGGPIQFFTLEELENPGSGCPIKTVPYKTPTANRFMHEPIRIRPTNNWLKARLDIPETLITDNHAQTYLHALECMRKAIQSPFERVIQDRDTGGWINCEGQFVLPADQAMYTMPHKLPLDLDRYGDLVRVLRYRPNLKYTTKPDVLEYIPNEKYTWKFVKSTMRSYCQDRVGGSRLWNDQYIRENVLNSKVVYSIHDYCPGMPVDLEYECELMKLHPFVHNEILYHPLTPEDKYAQYNLEGTVNNMVQKGILKDGQTHTIENFQKELTKIRKEYEDQEADWPFEIGRYILSLHIQRLFTIDRVLTQRVEQITKQLAEQALAQSDGHDGAPNGNVQEQYRHDQAVSDGVNQ